MPKNDNLQLEGELTLSEARFEAARKRIGLFLGPIVFLALLLYPIQGLAVTAHNLLAIIGLVLVFWLTEAIPIPVTALLGAVACVLFAVAPLNDIFAPFANPLVFLFIGSFILAESIIFNRLDRRFTYAIFSIEFLQKSPARVLLAMGLVSTVLSMWISNTAATAMIFPIALGVLAVMKEVTGGPNTSDIRKYSIAMMLIVAYGASVGGLATPIGTPPNLIGIGMIREFTGLKINFFDWMVFSMPITIAMFVALFFILKERGDKSFDSSAVKAFVAQKRIELGRWSIGEINTAIAFGIAVILWVAPSAAELALGSSAAITKFLAVRLNEGVVALFAACILFFMPTSVRDRTFTISWSRAVKIDWGTILLFGGGLSLGSLMFSTGLAEYIGKGLTSATGATGLWTITAIATGMAIILSETTSNTASANMAIPVMIAIAKGAGVNPIPPALGACLGASFGFMLPVSTPPNAIVFSSGLVPILSMVKKGVIFDVCGFILIMAGLYVMCPLMGWI